MNRLACLALAATLVYPALMLLYALQPALAVQAYHALLWSAKAGALAGLLGFCALAFVYPPFLENFRLFRQRLMRRMTADWREIQRLERLLASGGSPGLAFKLGSAYYQIEDYARAAAHFEKGLVEDPNPLVSAQFRLGVCYLQQNLPGRALPLLQKAHDREPLHASGEILLRLGEACRLTGHLASARPFYEAYEKFSGGNAELHYQFGLLHEAEGQRSLARQRMRQAVESCRRLPHHRRRFHRLHAARAQWFLLTRPG